VLRSELPPLIRFLAAAWVLLAGAVVGSFLNVVIARLPAGQSLIRPRSRCPGCGTPIAWYDNVPVISFLVLRARCRACRRPISWRYPLVEALGAAAAYLAYARHGLGAAALAELVLASILVALAFIDLDTWLLPHSLTVPLIVTGVAASSAHLTPAGSPVPSLIGAVAGGGAFWLVAVIGQRVFRKEAMGLGDVWLLAGIGAWMGHVALLPVVMFASFQGAIVGGVQVALGKGQPGPAPSPADVAEGAPPPGPAAAPADPAATPADPAATPPAAEPVSLPPADEASGAEGDEPWVPPRHAIPFGPFLALGTLEWLYLSDVLARAVPMLQPFV